NEGSTYLYEIDATTGQLILSDTIVGYDSYFMSSSVVKGVDVIALNAADGSGTGLFSIDSDGKFVLHDTTTTITEGSTSPFAVTTPDGSRFLVDADGTPETVEVLCFAQGTLITTASGEVAVEDLSQGDLVLTVDNGYQPVRWVGSQHLSGHDLETHPKLRPIRIRAGALGDHTPVVDLLVSPQHRILVSSPIALRMFGEAEVLVAAKNLVFLEGIDFAHDQTEVTYVHFLFDRHEVVFSNGARTESLYTGPQALKSVSPQASQEILSLFPELAGVDYEALSCRRLINGRMGRKLAERHRNNNSPVVQAVRLDRSVASASVM
ncbi:Hint domain-containing protein, partial [Rhodovulum imhoffii]